MSISDKQLILPLSETSFYPALTSPPVERNAKELGRVSCPLITDLYPDNSSGNDTIDINIQLMGGSVAGVNIIEIPSCNNIAVLPDLLNFGYRVQIVNTGVVLTRVDKFLYRDLGDETTQLSIDNNDYSLGWTLNYLGNTYTNDKQTPNGAYTYIPPYVTPFDICGRALDLETINVIYI